MIEISLSEWREQVQRLLAEKLGDAAGLNSEDPPLDLIQSAVKSFRSSQWQLTANGAFDFLMLVFPARRHDEVLFAIFLLTLFKRKLPPQTWDALEDWLEHVDHRVISDQLAINIAGRLVAEDKARWKQVQTWSQASGPWRRRFAVTTAGVVLKKDGTKPKDVLKLIDPLMNDGSLQVQNVVAWAIRQVASADEALAVSFLKRWKGRCHHEIFREAGLRLSPAARMSLLKAKSYGA